MKILVPVKRVPDPELKIKIQDGAIDLGNANWVLNPFDEYAVEAALRLVENADDGSRDGEVIVVTLGPDDAAQQLRSALAMGADRAIRVDAQDSDLDSRIVVDTLAAIVEAEKPDAVVMGKQAVDGDANQVGQMLAAKLRLPQATFAATIELAEDKSSVTVGREVDAGVEYKKIPLPGVITVDLRIVTPKAVINHVTPDSHEYQEGPRYASLKGIMKAKKKPMDVKSLGDFGVDASPSITRQQVELPPARPPGQIVESVQELVKKLNEEAKVL
ncbi:electron transfer flavoprotein subunit beta/FixA family protein [Haliangium ochraceum]|uniref:Electron transfer flavoprotein subunit beta n=1 Tax=Haliangium ochraceum (strain DSM 14365 / JCM 11303 / SMP-2) TaxID=502025 RepID=D0LRQ5_HALO1|nr:electron transfer flavoprotein subunit beta/FixA family protein [Haliangium ochraceum]ACY19047.1 Electron transfer flavoprotein alpha/beta- subunit [Haliangium ochraceum DSM 14365]